MGLLTAMTSALVLVHYLAPPVNKASAPSPNVAASKLGKFTHAHNPDACYLHLTVDILSCQ